MGRREVKWEEGARKREAEGLHAKLHMNVFIMSALDKF